jgi:hypothetical protein
MATLSSILTSKYVGAVGATGAQGASGPINTAYVDTQFTKAIGISVATS